MPKANIPYRHKTHVEAFRIWRAGVSVGWDCTAREIALDLGLPREYVRRLAARRGWPLLREGTDVLGRQMPNTGENAPVDMDVLQRAARGFLPLWANAHSV